MSIAKVISSRGVVPFCFCVLAAATSARAQVVDGSPPDRRTPASETIIVTAPGDSHARSNGLVVDAADLTRGGAADLFGALQRNLAGVSLSEAQSNPFQPNLVYRGFVASPLQGTAQGLAVYLDGGRFNQPFGDTVDFDLLPEAAIQSIAIEEASPIYGLNALGGAIVVRTKTGRSAPGATVSVAGGRYGYGEAAGEFGWAQGPWSAYAAFQANHDGGWRRHSPSTLYNGYADVGYDGSGFGVHVKLTGADSDLSGNGSAPVELLAADRRAVFTYPDTTRNRFERVSLHPWLALAGTTRIEASLYLQRLRQRTINGDAADIAECDGRPGLLCLQDVSGLEDALLDTGREPIPTSADGTTYGVLNRTSTRTTAGGALIQLVDRRPVAGGENVMTLGVSYDRSRTRFGATVELGALGSTRDVTGLGPIVDQPDGAIAPVQLIARTEYIGLFLADTLPITRRLDVTIGLRDNLARVRLDDRLGTALDGRHRFDRLNPTLALDYRFSRAIALHGGYAETNRAPTPAELACASPEAPCSLTNFFVGDPPLKQVIARTWQAGASGALGSAWKLQWHLSAYRAENSDDIQRIASPIRGRAYFQNIGRTRRQGVDATIDVSRGAITARLGYALTDATFRTPLVLSSADNPAAGADGHIAVERGDHLPGIPRERAIFSLDYAARAFTAGGDIQLQSGQYLFGDEGNQEPRTSGFAVVNLRASVRLLGPVALFGELTNAMDRRYATFGTFSETDAVYLAEAPGAADPRSLGPAAPRRWKAGLRATF